MDRAVAAPPRKPPDVPDRAARLTRGAWPRVLLIVGGLSAGTLPTPATADAVPAGSFSELSLEQLMEVDVVEVSSVGRQTRPLTETAAAAFVISSDDIRRSGATNIPEALRLAPGVEVARVDANKWAVSIRGFNGRFADKLLVMIDGMSVYTPFFCNVFWDSGAPTPSTASSTSSPSAPGTHKACWSRRSGVPPPRGPQPPATADEQAQRPFIAATSRASPRATAPAPPAAAWPPPTPGSRGRPAFAWTRRPRPATRSPSPASSTAATTAPPGSPRRG
ncbi:MAG: Plug domain-containing protein [Rhodospirillales bacterium]|nr:Plug domain-containing protein [Rhodospirillales bacterium]